MEDKTFELIEKLYGEFASFRKETRDRFDGVDEKFNGVDKRFDVSDNRFKGLEAEVKEIKKTLIRIEQNHGNKLEALFDGYKQHSDQLDRIEEKVSRHEDILVRKVK